MEIKRKYGEATREGALFYQACKDGAKVSAIIFHAVRSIEAYKNVLDIIGKENPDDISKSLKY